MNVLQQLQHHFCSAENSKGGIKKLAYVGHWHGLDMTLCHCEPAVTTKNLRVSDSFELKAETLAD